MTVVPRPATFVELLRQAGIACADIVVHRIALHPADRDEDYRTTADLVRTGHALIYERIQDGAIFGAASLVAGFVADGEDRVRFAGLRRLVARRPGVAPGDIIYDPEIAHLLHNFIARAASPTFYDAFEDEREPALRGLVLRWQPGSHDICSGDDPSLIIIQDQA